MSTCRWCTPGGALTTELLKKYATKELPNEDIVGANEDLCYCMQCVGEYHRVRDEVPLLHKALWQMETARLIIQLEKSMQEEIEEDDELFLVEEDGEKQLFGYTGPNFESNLRVPLLEILKYPYLLLNKHVTELCTEALCKMEHANNPFQVYEKLPGVYLLLVHPNEAVRRWAIMTARTQGKVDRDDYYDLKEVFTCLFKVIELGLFENPDIYGNSEVEEGKLILLPSHLYDISNYKNYWLGICMLLTVLEEQAMDSLLLSHDKQNDFMQSILHVMEKNTEDENANPFWPALHCFMIILDRLGSKVWGQLIDPIQAFQTIISSPSYTSEIETIRNSYSRPTKMEQHNDDNDLDISCSQMVYSFKTEKPNKDTGWKKAISPDYCPNMYEEMQSLANVLQSEIGQDMRVHDSTFLWFLPYVQSVMDLKDLGVPYIIEVIHHLYFEIKDVLNQRVQQCDKVTELFVLVLVSIIELHRNKKCLYLLWVSCHKWVEALVRCSLLPVKDVQAKSNSKMAYGITCSPTQSSSSVQHSCLQLIRSILREGCQLGQQTTCMQYLDKLNLVLRGNMSRTLELNSNEVRDLQACLRQIVKIIKDKASAAPSSTLEQNTNRIEFVPFIKSESVDDDEYWDRACSSLEKPSPATSPTEGFDGACWLTVKREPEEDKCSESELNYCKPTSSTVAVGIKKESIIQSEPAPPALTGEQQNRKPKQNLSELKSKLSKVLQKSSFKRQNSLPENINQKDEVEKQVPLESSEKCIPSTKPVKSEPHDSLFKPPSCNSSYSCSSSNIAVTKQLQRLSLENRDPEVKTVSVKTEAPLEDRQAPLENQISVVNSCEKRSSEPASEHCETSSPDDDDNLPLFVLRKKLLQKNKTQLTDSQVDRDLDALSMAAQAKSMNFHLDSSQDSVISQDQCQIQRKVKGTARSPHIDSSSSDTDISSDHIITISDSEDEESPNIATIKSEKTSPRGVCPSTSTSEFSKQIAEAQIKSEPPPSLTCDDYDSQLFEFETEDEVYSVWQDPYDDQKKPVVASSHSETSAELPISDPADTDMNNEFNEWGYDTDYISDDVLEKAAEAAEEMLTDSKQGNGLQKKNESVGSEGNLSVKGVHSSSFYRKDTQVTTAKQGEKTNIHISPKEASPLPSKVVHGKKTETVVAQKVKSKSKELKRTKSPLKSRGENVRRESLIRTSPAVVPPKKIRTGPDPSSTVEKLGFKKAPRKAFDLSQRSLDSLAELRNHGKMAGVVEPKRTKTKLISPQSLMVKCNKQMLACQDRQFYLQSRPKIHGKRKQAEASEGRSRKPENSSHKVDKNGNSGHFQATSSHAEVGSSTPRDDLKLSNNKECLEMSRTSANMSTAQNVEVPLSSKVENSSSHLLEKSVPSLSGDNAPTDDKESNYDEDDNDLFLTQMDPVDMEICSQVEYDIAIGDLEKGDTPQISNFSGSDAEMAKFATGIGTELPKMDDGLPMCKYRDCPEMVKDAGDHCPKHTPPEKVEDHLFAKPGLPPSLQKLSKPSTTKVFVLSNTSRTASLTKDIENLRQPQNATKAPIPKLPKPLTAQNRALDANSVLKPLNNQSNIPSKPSYTAVPEAGKSSPYTSQKPLQQRDQGWLMRELLRWTFEMFDNVSQFGPPSNLSQLPLVKVPLKFSSYEEYFNVYFPLMLLNTFESLAQDWSVKQQAINTHMCKLHLQNFCPDAQVNRGEFLAWFRDTDLCVQRHPKEDDLVFLCLPESGEEAQSHGAMVYHTGYVSRFNRSQKTVNQEKEQYTLCDLCIQTKGNLSAFRNQQVRCFVIGSLITTQRQFRALLQLQRNPLFRPIIMPNPTDFFPRDNVASETSSFPSLKEYNSDQKYAIERAYVMVKQQPRLPRICLIHGPPGTGKSKTIVGLLYRILMEKDSSSTVPVQNLNAKNKRNRVLVCAPSNAALDDLMKKIILEFKEKCYNKNNPLGNCGDINLVRLGAEKTISNDVVKFSLDCQVNHRITRAQQDQGLHKQKEMLDKKLDELSRRRALEKCNKNTCVPLDEEIARLSKERQLLANSLKEVRRRPQELQRTIILESHVICCTLSTSGGILLESAFRQLGQEPFSCVIVDEASQSCEVETLIPLLHRCSKLVLVGDPEQLPPTVISMKAEDLGYGQSLMSRMCRFLESTGTKSPVLQLTMQYRMHPDICLFPSHYFYKRMLKTDRATEEVRCSSDWPFQPYMVFDVADGYERKERESFCNPQEIKVAVALIKLIKSRKKDFCFRNIGVITPYRAQKMRIIEELKRAFANDIKPGEVDTVDGFQGRQKDCIIVTCVRANSTQGSIGFLASRQRLNVTITRAKFSLFILGSLRTLMENKDWNHLIQDAQRRGALIKTKEEHYQRDVNRILKLKPVVQRAPLNPSSRPEEKHKDNAATSPRIETPVEITQPPRKPLCPPSRPVIHPAVDCRRDSFKTRNAPSGSTVGTLPHAQRSKLQDPRLARPPPTSNSAQNSTHSSRPSSSVAGSSHPARRDSRTVSDGSRSSNSWNRDWDRGRKRTSELEQDPKKRKLSR